MGVSVKTKQEERGSIMGFLVYLKDATETVKIDAGRVFVSAGVLMFSKERPSDPPVAAIPLDNVWYVVKEKEKE